MIRMGVVAEFRPSKAIFSTMNFTALINWPSLTTAAFRPDEIIVDKKVGIVALSWNGWQDPIVWISVRQFDRPTRPSTSWTTSQAMALKNACAPGNRRFE